MSRPIPALILLLLSTSLSLHADSAIAGVWDCWSGTPDGERYAWLLTVTEQDGKLSGTARGERSNLTLIDPKMDGGRFSFRTVYEGGDYTVTVDVKGDRLEGAWRGGGETGKVGGTRRRE